MSEKQIEANRRNAQQSTGPQTPQGKAVAKMNALKHGILSTQVVVRGRHIKENRREFTALHGRFVADLAPMGPLEEMLVDQIVAAHWRLQRALTAESGEIALSAARRRGQCELGPNPELEWAQWKAFGNPVWKMRETALGNDMIERCLHQVRAAVVEAGELTEATIQRTVTGLGGKRNHFTLGLEALQLKLQANPEGLDAAALRERNQKKVLAYLDIELGQVAWWRKKCEQREAAEEEAAQAAAVLPAAAVLDKILRYETKLERQMYRAMHQLERLQRMRQGETLPAPVAVEVSERG